MQAGIDLIDANGAHHISVRAIARQAAVARWVVYRQFEDRADLDRHVRSAVAALLTDHVEPALYARGVVDLSLTISSFTDWIRDHPRLYAFLRTGSNREDRGVDAATAWKAMMSQRAGGLLSAATKPAGVSFAGLDAMVLAVISLVEGAVTQWVRDGERYPSKERLVRELTELSYRLAFGVLGADGSGAAAAGR